jgi:hypothetical protein
VSLRLTVALLDLGGRQTATRGAVLLPTHCLAPAGLLLYAVDLVLRAGQLSNTTVVACGNSCMEAPGMHGQCRSHGGESRRQAERQWRSLSSG